MKRTALDYAMVTLLVVLLVMGASLVVGKAVAGAIDRTSALLEELR